MRSWGLARFGLLAAVLTCVAAVVAASASASPGRYQLRGSVPGWLHQAHQVGSTPSAQQVNFGVLLNMRDQAGAEATLQAISDPTSASYGQWLTNGAFDAALRAGQDRCRRGAELAALARASPSTTRCRAACSSRRAASPPRSSKTFGTQLNNYSYQGKTVRANSTALSLPASTPAAVSGVDRRRDRRRPGLRAQAAR